MLPFELLVVVSFDIAIPEKSPHHWQMKNLKIKMPVQILRSAPTIVVAQSLTSPPGLHMRGFCVGFFFILGALYLNSGLRVFLSDEFT